MGRATTSASKLVSVRVPNELHAQLTAIAARLCWKRSAVIVAALQQYLERQHTQQE